MRIARNGCVLLRVFILSKARRAVTHTRLLPGTLASNFTFSLLIDTSVLHDEQCKAEFPERLGKHKRSLGASLEKQVGDLQRAFRDSAIRAVGRPRKGLVATWISKRTWKVVQLGGLIWRLMHNSRKRAKTLFMSVASYRWTSLFSAPFPLGKSMSDLQDAKCRGWLASARSVSNLQLWASLVRTEAIVHRAIAHVQRLARPRSADDRRVHFKNKAWEIQKDMTAGRLHETDQKGRLLGARSKRSLKTAQLESGELTTTEAQRQQRWQLHF